MFFDDDRNSVLYFEKDDRFFACPVFLEFDITPVDALEAGIVPYGFFELRAVIRIPPFRDYTADQLLDDVGELIVIGGKKSGSAL